MKQQSSFTRLTPGVYIPGNSVLHRTPAAWKIILGLGIFCLAAWGRWLGIVAVFAICLSGIILADIGFRAVARKLRAFVWFILTLGLLPAFFTPGTPVAAGYSLGLTWEGLEEGALVSCRLAVMFLVSMLLMHATAPADLFAFTNSGRNGDSWLWASIKRTGTVGLMAFQLLPIVCVEVETRLIAELDGGKGAIRGNFFNKAGRAARLLIPLTVFVFENTELFAKRLNDEADRK